MIDKILEVVANTTILEMSILFLIFSICLLPLFPQKTKNGDYKKTPDGKVKKLSVFGVIIRAVDYGRDEVILEELQSVKDEVDTIKKHFDDKIIENNSALRREINHLAVDIDNKIDHLSKTMEAHKKEGEHRSLKHRADDIYRHITRTVEKMQEGKKINDNRLKGLYNDVLWYVDYCNNHNDYKDGICLTDCKFIEEEYKKRFHVMKGE